jgi:phosphonate transport system substrate-binding protein
MHHLGRERLPPICCCPLTANYQQLLAPFPVGNIHILLTHGALLCNMARKALGFMDNLSEPNSNVSRQASSRTSIRWVGILKAGLVLVLLLGVAFSLYNVVKARELDRRITRFIPRQWVDLNKQSHSAVAAALNAVTGREVFRVAIAPIVSPEKSLEMYQGFINYIAEKLGRKPVSIYRPTYSETNDLVRFQQCDIAVVCTYPFIRGEEEFGMQVLVVPRIKGETTYQSFILVPASSSAKSLLDLRGKKFGSADIISTTGWLFPAIVLMNAGENPNKFFGKHILTGSHDRSLQAVVDGFVDGAAVHGIVYDQMVAEDPSILKKTKILLKSQPFSIPPIVVNPNLDKALRDAILSVLLNMHNDARGKRILEKLQIEKFEMPQKGLFDDVRQAVAQLEGFE